MVQPYPNFLHNTEPKRTEKENQVACEDVFLEILSNEI